MPEVPLVATGPFTYRTRRLVAGDEFNARNPLDARILTKVRKVADAPVRKVAETKEVVPAMTTKPKKAPNKGAGAKARAKKAAAKK